MSEREFEEDAADGPVLRLLKEQAERVFDQGYRKGEYHTDEYFQGEEYEPEHEEECDFSMSRWGEEVEE
jgi:hypothetical protein